MIDSLLSIGSVESVTIVESIEISGPLATNSVGGVAIGIGLAGGLVIIGTTVYLLSE
jgi:hypothetical protein